MQLRRFPACYAPVMLAVVSAVFLLASGACRAAGAGDAAMPGMDMHAPSAAHHDHAASASFGEPYTGTTPSRTIAIAMGYLSFAPAHIDVRRGEAIRFVVTNTSTIEHDFTLGDTAAEASHRAAMAADMAAGHAAHHHHEGNAMTVKPGATGTLAWLFSKPGSFEYDCNIPGHFEAGMAGTITVSP